MKTITVGILNYNQPEFTYYSVLNIKKIFADYNPVIKIFDTGIDRQIENHLDDVKILRNNYAQYFDHRNMEYTEIYAKAMRALIDDNTTDEFIMVLPQVFLKKTLVQYIDHNQSILFDNANGFDLAMVTFNFSKIEKPKFNNFAELSEFLYSYQKRPISLAQHFVKSDGTDIVSFLKTNEIYWKTVYEDVIVSLTSFKGRINDDTTKRVLLSLLHQRTNYNYRVALVLSEEEFLDKSIPLYLQQMLEDYSHFEIIWTFKNTKPLKKLDPTMEKYPDLPIITLDDDDLASSDMVEIVVNEHRKDPYKVLGSWVEQTVNFIKWVAAVRLWPPHCLYQFPLDDYYTYYDGILDDNFNAMRCAFKMTPVRGMPEVSEKCNQTDLKLATEYQSTNWGFYYKRFILNHLNELPEELYYIV